MTITVTTHPYEILIRFGEDGTVQGSHAVRLQRVLDGDTIIAATVLPAEPLSGDDFTAAIGGAAASALDGKAASDATATAALAAKVTAESALASAEAVNSDLQATADARAAEIAQLTDVVSAYCQRFGALADAPPDNG